MTDNPNLNNTLDNYIAATSKSKVAVIVPLFGYWNDVKTDQLNEETLKWSLDRIYSSVHNIYIIFVGELGRTAQPVADILIGKKQGGNVIGVAAKRGWTYADYLREGFKVAQKETDAAFIINVNPWLLCQHNGIDILVDRINRDDVNIVSGFDTRGTVQEGFDMLKYNAPIEENDLNLDFMGMKRYAAEMIDIDINYKSHYFIARDMWQSSFAKGFNVITTQSLPIFSFDIDWSDLESREDFEADKAYFISKWKFDPSIKYV